MTIAQQIKWDFETNGSLIIQDKYNKLIYIEASDRFWVKKEHDSQGNCIHYETSNGEIIDNRPKPCENKSYTEKEVENLLMTQRENCYVSILSVTNDKKLAELAIKSPEPYDWRNQMQSEIF
jgi:hypothetical protein